MPGPALAILGTIEQPVDDALSLAADLRSMMAGELEPTEERFGELVALKGVVQYPIRIKCAVLAWDVLQEALDGLGSDLGGSGAGEAAGSASH